MKGFGVETFKTERYYLRFIYFSRSIMINNIFKCITICKDLIWHDFNIIQMLHNIYKELIWHVFVFIIGSFHLMHLMFDDYVLYLVESLHSQERGNEFLRIVKGDEKDGRL